MNSIESSAVVVSFLFFTSMLYMAPLLLVLCNGHIPTPSQYLCILSLGEGENVSRQLYFKSKAADSSGMSVALHSFSAGKDVMQIQRS